MKIGVFSTFMSPLATPRMIRDFGRRAEDMGLDSIWMGEHVALFDKNTFGYPGSKDGPHSGAGRRRDARRDRDLRLPGGGDEHGCASAPASPSCRSATRSTPPRRCARSTG